MPHLTWCMWVHMVVHVLPHACILFRAKCVHVTNGAVKKDFVIDRRWERSSPETKSHMYGCRGVKEGRFTWIDRAQHQHWISSIPKRNQVPEIAVDPAMGILAP